ncbi:MAG TPA: ABC transporter ATP-binding protein [Anaerolineaceae bacterium]|nr:ABC transporter ATP-binding protein [Anaerolineaceae bacterium]HQP09211.1 ABC transporter ATP-binding protein [Anaerolineaceae bacterium]
MTNIPLIQIQQLRKVFTMGKQKVIALAGIDIDIPENSFTVIMGPSGSGKSTLLYLLGGLDRPTSGRIMVNQQSIESMDENALAQFRRNSIGFIFQSFNLLPSMDTLRNVGFPLWFSGISKTQRDKRAMDLLRTVGMDNRALHKPTELSGGQQQRAAIARALVNNPPLILADEPTGNLDTTSGLGIMQLLSDLHRSGRTVIVVTHDPRMLHFSTHTLYLLDGRLVSEAEYTAAASMITQVTQPEENPTP